MQNEIRSGKRDLGCELETRTLPNSIKSAEKLSIATLNYRGLLENANKFYKLCTYIKSISLCYKKRK